MDFGHWTEKVNGCIPGRMIVVEYNSASMLFVLKSSLSFGSAKISPTDGAVYSIQ